LRHLNTAHRSKPGGNSVSAESAPNYNVTKGDDKQTTISVVTSASVLNNAITQKNASVASLQALKATLCKPPQSVDPSKSPEKETEVAN